MYCLHILFYSSSRFRSWVDQSQISTFFTAKKKLFVWSMCSPSTLVAPLLFTSKEVWVHLIAVIWGSEEHCCVIQEYDMLVLLRCLNCIAPYFYKSVFLQVWKTFLKKLYNTDYIHSFNLAALILREMFLCLSSLSQAHVEPCNLESTTWNIKNTKHWVLLLQIMDLLKIGEKNCLEFFESFALNVNSIHWEHDDNAKFPTHF